jgi:hypothetical protein
MLNSIAMKKRSSLDFSSSSDEEKNLLTLTTGPAQEYQVDASLLLKKLFH